MQIANLSIYKQRRTRLAAMLCKDALAVIATAPERQRNRDSDYLYRHDSYFYYLTGFTEPNAVLVVNSNGQSTLFCQPKDEAREIWDGYRLGVDAAGDGLGVDAAFSIDVLDETMARMVENCSALYYPFAIQKALDERIPKWLACAHGRARYGAMAPSVLRDACLLLDEMRLIKDEHELAIMRQAARISAQAHIKAMQTCASMIKQGENVYEYHLDAQLLGEFRRHGSQCPAYGNIVAAGANACILHYRADKAPIQNGDLVLIDAGCELDGYASDITRTFAANGKFTVPQQQLYDLVLQSQQAAIASTKAGVRFTDPHESAVAVLSQGMLDLGLLDRNKVGNVQDVIENKAYMRFYMHRTGHWLGMDVHDCGSYNEPSEIGKESRRKDALSDETIINRPSRILQPQMVLTIEPAIYVRAAADVPQKFHNIGIRIEDDAVVTATGCELITRDVPVAIHEIEALMR